MRLLVLTLAVLSSFTLAYAQEAQVVQRQAQQVRIDSSQPEAQKLTPEQRERAMQLLEGAAAGARSLDPGSRAYALMQVARVYASIDKKKAIELLDEAITAAGEVARENDRLKRVGSDLQEQVLKAMVPLAPEKASEYVLQLDGRAREQVLQALVDYYQQQKKTDRALELVYRTGAEGEIPYGAAAKIMETMTPEQASEKQQLFTAALASYQDHDHADGGVSIGNDDFADMIVRFQKDLPPGLVHQAIDAVLDSARKRAEKQSGDAQPMTISIASAQGAVQMNSLYQYRLFQLLPVLRTIDPQQADKLLKEQTDVQTLLAKYPQGMNSVAPDRSDAGPGRPSNMSMMVNSGGGGGAPNRSGPRPGAMNPLEMQKAAKIAEDAEKHPQDALANAASLQSDQVRLGAYMSIAQVTWKKQPSIARQALAKAADAIDKLEGDPQLIQYANLARFYMRLGETEDAKKYIEKGMDASARVFKADSNADDPNQAPKAYWPSVAGWKSLLSLGSQISPLWAATLLKEIPDDEARTLAQLGIATALLQAEPSMTEIMTVTKGRDTMMIMGNDYR
jgi:tetratricopeptide (TPR) repeat protein